MNTKKIFKSTVAMIMASLVITAGTAVAATSAVEAGSVTASAISIHEFQIRDFKAYNPYGGQMKTSAPVEFSFDLSEADKGSYDTYMTSYVEVTKDGVQHAMINFKAGDTKCRFNPTEAGTYTAKIYVVDCRGNYGSKTINFYVKNLDDVNISKFEIAPIYSSGMTISNSFKFNYQIDNAQKSNNRYTCAYIEVMKDGVNPIWFDGLFTTVSSEESKALNADQQPKVIIASGGMCEGGRIRHHLKHNLWNAKNTILFAGYQAAGTLGRIIYDGAKSVKIFGEEIDVSAEIRLLEGISGHADQRGLLAWLSGAAKMPEYVFVNHGDDDSCTGFAELVREEYGIQALAPASGSQYDLLKAEWIRAVCYE